MTNIEGLKSDDLFEQNRPLFRALGIRKRPVARTARPNCPPEWVSAAEAARFGATATAQITHLWIYNDTLKSLSERDTVSLRDMAKFDIFDTRTNNAILRSNNRSHPELDEKTFLGDVSGLGQAECHYLGTKIPGLGAQGYMRIMLALDVFDATDRFSKILDTVSGAKALRAALRAKPSHSSNTPELGAR